MMAWIETLRQRDLVLIGEIRDAPDVGIA